MKKIVLIISFRLSWSAALSSAMLPSKSASFPSLHLPMATELDGECNKFDLETKAWELASLCVNNEILKNYYAVPFVESINSIVNAHNKALLVFAGSDDDVSLSGTFIHDIDNYRQLKDIVLKIDVKQLLLAGPIRATNPFFRLAMLLQNADKMAYKKAKDNKK